LDPGLRRDDEPQLWRAARKQCANSVKNSLQILHLLTHLLDQYFQLNRNAR
jgi:hypothetical protein